MRRKARTVKSIDLPQLLQMQLYAAVSRNLLRSFSPVFDPRSSALIGDKVFGVFVQSHKKPTACSEAVGEKRSSK
jgi:hypothetical protein